MLSPESREQRAGHRRFLALRRGWAYGKGAPVAPGKAPRRNNWSRCRTDNAPRCCRSSVVEHPLGKGEADSSILSGSTRNLYKINALRNQLVHRLSRHMLEQC